VTETITWTRAKLNRLKTAIEEAKKQGEEVFTFEGHTLVLTYAYYLAEHLERQLGE